MEGQFAYVSEGVQLANHPPDSILENSELPEDESFDFAGLHHDLQYIVLEKFDYKDFAVFDETSYLAHTLCTSQDFSVPFEMYCVMVNKKTTKFSNVYLDYERGSVPRIPWNVVSGTPVQVNARTVAVMCPLSSGRIQAVTKCFEKNRIKVKFLKFRETMTCPKEDLERFMKICSPFRITFMQFLPRLYFNCPSLQNVGILYCENTGCTDEDLVNIKAKDFKLTADLVTSKGLNVLLKQWKRREREITHMLVKFGSTPLPRRVEDVIRGVEANLIWSWDSHHDSILHEIPLEELPLFSPGEYIYSLWRSDDPLNTLFLHISTKSFDAWIDKGEARLLLQWLNYDQYFVVTKKCPFCLTEFCRHRRKYSTVRLKRYVPRIYSGLMNTLRILSVSSALASTFNFITGERPYYRATFSDRELIQEDTGVSKALAFARVHLFDYV